MFPNKWDKVFSQTWKNWRLAVFRASEAWDNPYKPVGSFLSDLRASWGSSLPPFPSNPAMTCGRPHCSETRKIYFLPFSVSHILGPSEHSSAFPHIHSPLSFLASAFTCLCVGETFRLRTAPTGRDTQLLPRPEWCLQWLWMNPWGKSDGTRALSELPICSLKYKTQSMEGKNILKN